MNEKIENNSGGNGGEIITIPNQSLSEMTDDIIASAEKRINNVQKIITLALKITNEQDWIDQQGKPYLMASGAEKVARLFGVCWRDIKTDKRITEDEKGQYYFYQVSGIFSLRNDSILAIGTCSSHDQFFARRKNKETGETELKPLSEVDETNVMKAAYSNCVQNGVCRLLGLRNLTWEQVKATGLSQEKVSSVKYASFGAGGGLISEAQGKRLFAILQSGSKTESDRKLRNEFMHSYISLYLELQTTKEIKTKDYEIACAVAEHISKQGSLKGIEAIRGVPAMAGTKAEEKPPVEAYQ